jgi:hypothetical protein
MSSFSEEKNSPEIMIVFPAKSSQVTNNIEISISLFVIVYIIAFLPQQGIVVRCLVAGIPLLIAIVPFSIS